MLQLVLTIMHAWGCPGADLALCTQLADACETIDYQPSVSIMPWLSHLVDAAECCGLMASERPPAEAPRGLAQYPVVQVEQQLDDSHVLTA
jgi:hypothetical protein